MFEALNLDAKQVAKEEEAIRLTVRELSDAQRLVFYESLSEQLKDPDTYAMLNYFFLTGLHHMYLGNYTRGAINMSLLLAGIVLAISGAFIFGGLIIVFIVCVEMMALFRSQVVVQDHNNKLSRKILSSLD
ncbi:MAG: TM2 domain-containing protein [Pseudomonadales bacterium]|jgi:hypothetical protein|nr:TM2 domain-containing protein [Pseudomonadales bacterium]